jgi:integrase
VLGPYRERDGYFRIIVRQGGRRDPFIFGSEKDAQKAAQAYRLQFAGQLTRTINATIIEYGRYLTEEGRRPGSIQVAEIRLRAFFNNANDHKRIDLRERLITGETLLGALSPDTCVALYRSLRERPGTSGRTLATDTHQNTLSLAKTFLSWCVKRRYLQANPAAEVEPVGRKRRGKPQLRIDEARKWMAAAIESVGKGEEGAIAALMTLLLGLRASEVVSRVVRDLDDDGRLLWIPDSKTEAGKRTVEVPEVLRPPLREVCVGRKPLDPIFRTAETSTGHRHRQWVLDWVRRLCQRAGLIRVCAHSMRGLHATLATEHGVTGHVVAQALGHTSPAVTYGHYARPGSVQTAQQRAVLRALKGGE